MPTPPNPRISKQTPLKTAIGRLAYIVFLLLVGAVASLAGWMNSSHVGGAIISALAEPPEKVFHDDANLTLLLLGCDSDIDEHTKKVIRKQARSDMMLVANLDFRNHKITGVSIPRDTYCVLPGYEKKRVLRINGYHSIAPKGQEAELTKQAVEYLLPGVVIDRVLTIDYDEFEKMVDAIGGINIDVERTMDYDDNAGKLHIHLKEGPAMLNGHDAIGYVRYRHGDSDFERQKRQKHFLIAFKDRVKSQWTQLGVVADMASHALGDTLSAKEFASIALFAKGIKPEDIKMGMIPVVEGKGTLLEVDEDKLEATLREYNLIQDPNYKSKKHER